MYSTEQRATIRRMERVNLRRLPDEWTAEDEALAQAVDDATATPIYIPYRLAPEWLDGVNAALDQLEDQLQRRLVVVLTLLEHSLFRLERAAVDDSDGGMVDVGERIHDLLMACVDAAGLSPDETAARLTTLAALDLWPAES